MARPGPALAAVALLVLLVLTGGCSDMLERSQADAVVVLDAPDRAAVLRLRQEVLAQAGTWGGVRVGEKTAEQDGDTALTFALPGPNLDIALSGIGRLKAEVRSTSIDVDPEQVDRTTPATGTDGRAEDNSVRLRVEIDEQRPAGAGADAAAGDGGVQRGGHGGHRPVDRALVASPRRGAAPVGRTPPPHRGRRGGTRPPRRPPRSRGGIGSGTGRPDPILRHDRCHRPIG